MDRSARETSKALWFKLDTAICASRQFLRQSLAFYARRPRDVIRRNMFFHSVRWHADELDEMWTREEARINHLLDRAAGDYRAIAGEFPRRLSLNPRYFVLDLMQWLMPIAERLRVVLAALTGNRQAAVRIRRKLSTIVARCRWRNSH